MNDEDVLVKYIKESKYTVFFGGAGVSTESGLKDFRSKDGLYNEVYKYNPEIILSHSFFVNKPIEFYKFYKDKLNSLKYKPNITHLTLTMLEDKGLLNCIITQNIDGFHQEAKSKNVLELHGSIHRNYCCKCHKFYDSKFVFNSEGIPKCSCGGIIKPDVILYEEALNQDVMLKAIKEIATADLLIIGGTSLSVYPAASLINYFKGRHIIIVNKDEINYPNSNILIIKRPLGEMHP